MDKTTLIKQLSDASKLESEADFQQFEDALDELATQFTTEDIPAICKIFSDSNDETDYMYALIHLMEDCVGDAYLYQIAVCTPQMLNAREWAKVLNIRIVNSDKYLNDYIRIISGLEREAQNQIIALLREIRDEYPQKVSLRIDNLLTNVKLK